MKFETIMSLKRVPLVTIVFRTTRLVQFGHVGEFIDYLKKRVFGAFCYADDTNYLSRFKHDLSIYQHGDSDNNEVFFSLDIVRPSKYDLVLDRVFESVHLYNLSLDRVNHRTGECNVVHCSDTVYFLEMSKRLFVDNSVTFIYCYLTNKYKPVIESNEDTDAFGLAKILSSVEYSTKCSLKRNHNSRIGHGPLSSVISEGGLNESAKFVNNMVRDHILRPRDGSCSGAARLTNFTDSISEYVPQSPAYSPTPVRDYVPQSPTYSPIDDPPGPCGQETTENLTPCDYPVTGTSPLTPPLPVLPVTVAVEESGTEVMRSYAINEPYVNTFLNRPVECGNMY